MTIQSSAGASLSIGAPGTDQTAGPMNIVAEITNMGEFGRVYQLITHDSLDQRGTRKLKGSFNDGALTLQLGRDPGDVGQEMCIEARDSDESYAFRVTLDDAGSGAGATPTTFDFDGLVMSYTTNVGAANQIVGATVQIEIQSGTIVETPATAGT